MLGNIKIFFGTVVDIEDDIKKFRCRVTIDNYTNKIDKTLLPWYFPWYGVNFLPELNDVVSVIIFDDNFATGFYGKKIDNLNYLQTDTDYNNYLEIFSRVINDNDVKLIYTESKGIEFINKNNKIQVEIDKLTFFSGTNQLKITEDKIELGNANLEASLLGDKTVTELHNIITHQNNIISEIFDIFDAIKSASSSPYTIAIQLALTPLLPVAKSKLKQENSTVDSNVDNIQSKKVYIE